MVKKITLLLLATFMLSGCGMHTFTASPVDGDRAEDDHDCFHVYRDRLWTDGDSMGLYCEETR